MKPSFSLLAVFCCVLNCVQTRTVFAQAAPTPTEAAALTKLVPRPERLEGAVSVSRGGITTRATLRFQAPDALRVDVLRDDAIAVLGATYLSRGGAAQSVEPDGRVRRWRFGSVTQPWRSDALADGGPANIALFGWPQDAARVYQVSIAGDTSKADGGFTITMQARAIDTRLVADGVRSGDLGPDYKGGLNYFNTFKRTVYDRPFRIVLRLSPQGALMSREDRDELNRVLKRTDFERDAQTGSLLGATVRDAGKRLVEVWKYDLKARAEAFPDNMFELDDAARQQIVEDAEPLALGDYAGEGADALWNRGNVLWRQAEEATPAMAAWDAAAKAKPQAVAPHMAIFDAAMRVHDLERAASAVSRLAQLRGETGVAVALRRAELAIARRDWQGAKQALDVAQNVQPLNLSTMLRRAELARGQGDEATARALLSEIVSSAAQQPETQAAAEALAALVGLNHENSEKERQAAFDLLPKTAGPAATTPIAAAATAANGVAANGVAANGATQWQRLARAHLALLFGQSEKGEARFEDNYALASLARGQERAGQDAAAIASWQAVAARAPGTLSVAGTPGTLAREHLVALQARRGDAQASLRAYRTLMAQAPDETARERARDTLLDAWHKNFRGGELRITLKQIATAGSSSDEDNRLWLAWQERYASRSDIEATIRSGARRFSSVAWWHSRLSDFAAATGSILPEINDNNRVRWSQLAQSEAARAAKLDASQPFYAVQAALAPVQRAVILMRSTQQDLSAQKEANAIARRALDNLERAWPADPDVAIALASGRDALYSPAFAADASAITSLEAALRRGAPDAAQVGQRHAALFFGRQALALMLRRAGRFDEATRQLESLFDAARDPNEALGIAITQWNYAQRRTDLAPALLAGTGARLLRRLAGNWSLDASRAATSTFAETILRSTLPASPAPGAAATAAVDTRMPVATAISTLLVNAANAPNADVDANDKALSGDAASALAAAHLHFAMQRLGTAQLARPSAPAAWERFKRVADGLAASSLAALKGVAGGDTFFGSRAAALLQADAVARGDLNEAARWLALAIRGEPQSLELRALLTRVQIAATKPAEALAARDDILRAAPSSVDALRRAGVLSASLNNSEDAARYAMQALNIAQTTREVSIEQTQAVAFSLAHILLAQGQFDRAAPLYTGLAADQWPLEDRLAALLDWEARLRAMDKTEEAARARAQATALAYTDEDVKTAQRILRGMQ